VEGNVKYRLSYTKLLVKKFFISFEGVNGTYIHYMGSSLLTFKNEMQIPILPSLYMLILCASLFSFKNEMQVQTLPTLCMLILCDLYTGLHNNERMQYTIIPNNYKF
jgi:hypothetical protein